MKKNKKDINFFDDIHVSKELDERILNNTIYKKKINHKYKYAILIIVLLSCVTTVVLAQEYIRTYYTNKVIDDKGYHSLIISLIGKVKIAEHSDIPYENNFTINDIEESLNIKLLNVKGVNKSTFDFKELKKDDNGEIRLVKLYNRDNYFDDVLENGDNHHNPYLYIKISFMTNYANEEDEEEFKNIDIFSSPQEELVEKYASVYHLKNLDVDVQVFDGDIPIISAAFVYENVVYQFVAMNMKREEVINTLESIKI